MALLSDAFTNARYYQQPTISPTPDGTQLEPLEFTPGTFTESKPQVTLQELGLSMSPLSRDALALPSLKTEAPKASEWLTDFAPLPKYEPMKVTRGVPSVGASGARSGSFGPSAYGWSGVTGVKGTRGSAPFGFQSQMWQALSAANAAMKAAGLGQFGVTDGWRSYESQVALKAKKGKLAATPGRSVHGLGLAADLKLSGKQLAWLKKNGSRFGLINLPSESWHWQLDSSLWKGW